MLPYQGRRPGNEQRKFHTEPPRPISHGMTTGSSHQGRIIDLLREVILTGAFAIHISRGAVEASTKWVRVTERNRNHVHAQLVHLLSLIHI